MGVILSLFVQPDPPGQDLVRGVQTGLGPLHGGELGLALDQLALQQLHVQDGAVQGRAALRFLRFLRGREGELGRGGREGMLQRGGLGFGLVWFYYA